MTRGTQVRDRGVSLIEALVALAVMAFGMLGVVGMQSTLRFNSDIAKQRSEAVRIVQETVEQRRNFSTISALAGHSDFDAIVSRATVAMAGTNATFTVSETATTDSEAAPMKTLVIGAAWQDRTDQTQLAQVTTIISRSSPAISAALVTPAGGGAAQRPNGRNSSIPRSAVDLGNGTSRLDLPPPVAGPLVSWIFNNATGVIQQVCLDAVCTAADLRLLAGFISFATGPTQPSVADAAVPSSTAVPMDVTITVTDPLASPVLCITGLASPFQYVEYFCALPVNGSAKWSGYPTLSGVAFALSATDANALAFRACRYTPNASGTTTLNSEHPATYTDVTDGLLNQNFLVIRAGDGTTPFTCPGDDPGRPGNTNTFPYQPAP